MGIIIIFIFFFYFFLGIIEAYANKLEEILKKSISSKLKFKYEDVLNEPCLDQMLTWLDLLFKWLGEIIQPMGNIQSWKSRLNQYFYEQFVNLRINQLFEIIVEFPCTLRCPC